MNILEQTEALKDLPDQALIKEMQMPTGMAPPVFITAELKRRQRMRDDFKRREAQDMPTVAEEVVMAAGMPQGGIADAAKAMAPKSSIAQNTGMNEMMPAAPTRAPQRMAEGGIMKLREGGKLVKVGNARFYAFPDGEVYVENPDGSRESVTDPRVLGVVRGQANVAPERQESAAPLGSEVLREAAPQAPSLESAISSDRSFNPQQMEVTDTRPSVPSDYGMGGERPAIVESLAQPTFSPDLDGQGVTLLSAADAGVDPFGVPQRITSENRDADPEVIPASEQLPTRPRSIDPTYSETAYPMFSESTYEQGLESTPQQSLRALGVDLDLTGGSANKKDLDAFFKSQEMRGGRPGGSLPVDVLSQPVTDDTYRMPDVTGPETTASGFFPDLEQAQAADEAARQRGISELGLSPIVSGGTEYLVNDAGNMFKVAGGKLVGVSGGEAMQAIDVAQKQGADFTKSPVGTMPIGTRGVDPDTGLIDPDSPFVPASLDIGGLETPSIVGETLQGSGLADIFNRDVVSSDSPDQPPKLTPTGFSPDPEALQLDDSVVDMAAATGTPTLGGGDPALEQGIASALAPVVTGNVGNEKDVGDGGGGGGGGGGGIVPTGGAATGLEARIAQMLSDREADRETDKYMALAQAGLALMASNNPTLGGAIGEAGLAGVGALKKAKSQYDADILGLMGLEEKARSSRLSRQAALAKANRPKAMTGTEKAGYFDRASELEDQIAEIEAQLASGKQSNPVTGLMTDDMTDEAKALLESRLVSKKSQMNKFLGIANPQLANVQTVNP